ncbi:hypothetical protein [Fibrobacter sp.]|uniref:hypothetical protein n=1 Tax=Fibrobacter sp. TaxID=35828 RepID=UPI00388EE1D9
MSKLDDRIREDLGYLYADKKIKRAVDLGKKLSFDVSTKGEPAHFFGERSASTVVVMLNPGCIAENADKKFAEISKGWNRKSLKGFVESYIDHKMNGAGRCPECCRPDAFDVKQAAFLKPWTGCGIVLPKNFETNENKLLAKKKVLLQKLQLELVPFASQTTKFQKDDYDLLLPYLEDCLDEIFAKNRKYVILCGSVFEHLLKKLKEKGAIDADFSNKKKKVLKSKKLSKGITVHCMVAEICYNGKRQRVLVAHTFASRALPNAYGLMEKYGKFCFETFQKTKV